MRTLYSFLCAVTLLLLHFCQAGAQTTPRIIITIAGNGGWGYTGDGGPATAADFDSPYCVVLDTAGNKYIADYSNFVIRKVKPNDTVRTFAGTGVDGYSGDGGAALHAKFAHITGLAVDHLGNVYVADDVNHSIRKINASGVVTTIAGNGVAGYTGDGGPASGAQINTPEDVVLDGAGNMLIADYGNHVIRMINSSGIITTIAGTGGTGYSGDGGPAIAAQVVPFRLAVDTHGNIYVTEFWGNRVRKINAAGTITTFAGNGDVGAYGFWGPATSAPVDQPSGIAVDNFGNVLIGAVGSHYIFKVTPSGMIAPIAGTGVSGYTGDYGSPLAAKIADPRNVVCDAYGNVYFADYDEAVVREITAGDFIPEFTRGRADTFSVCRNAAATSIDSILAVQDTDFDQTETWTVVQMAAHGLLSGFPYATVTTGSTLTPSSLSYMPASGYTGSDSFVIKVSDGLYADTITIHVNVDPLPVVGPIRGPSAVCQSSFITLTDTTTGGRWTSANGDATVAAGRVTGMTIGSDIISYTISNACGSVVATHAVSIDSFPSAGVIDFLERGICPGDTMALVDFTTGGVWSSLDTAIATVATTGVATGVSAGTDTIYYIHSNTCGADTASVQLYVLDHTSCNAGVHSIPTSSATILSIAPNPSYGKFSVTVPGSTGSGVLSITDVLGKTIETHQFLNGIISEPVDLSAMPGGTYFLKVDIAGIGYVGKVTVW